MISRAGTLRLGASLSPILWAMTASALFASSAFAVDLIDAVRNQDSSTVQSLLTDGADPNARQPDGATALHWAAYRDNAELVATLLDSGADVDAVNRLGASALYIAAKSGNGDLIEQLLKAGARPDVALELGETPLMTASQTGSVKGVRLLLAAGADVNVRENSRNQTALMWAAAQGHTEVARLLIAAGADLEARSMIRPRLMFSHRSNGGAFDSGFMEKLGGFSPLLFAARQGHVDMAQLLLSSGADVDGTAGNGASPVVLATHSGHTELTVALLEQGADANAMGAGYSALHAAILRGDLVAVEALLEHGADANVRLEKPNAIQRASEDWAFKTEHVGATPYWLAANFREASIMRALADFGADPAATNLEIWSQPRNRGEREDWTPEAIGGFTSAVQAAVSGDSTRARYYVQANPDPVGEEQLALAAVRLAADQGVNLNHADLTESTALHDAARRSLPNIVRELAERGADVNALNGQGRTPLDLALASENRFAQVGSFVGEAPIPGPKASEILQEFGAVRSSQ